MTNSHEIILKQAYETELSSTKSLHDFIQEIDPDQIKSQLSQPIITLETVGDFLNEHFSDIKPSEEELIANVIRRYENERQGKNHPPIIKPEPEYFTKLRSREYEFYQQIVSKTSEKTKFFLEILINPQDHQPSLSQLDLDELLLGEINGENQQRLKLVITANLLKNDEFVSKINFLNGYLKAPLGSMQWGGGSCCEHSGSCVCHFGGQKPYNRSCLGDGTFFNSPDYTCILPSKKQISERKTRQDEWTTEILRHLH